MPVKHDVINFMGNGSKGVEDYICLIRRHLLLRGRTTMRCVGLVGCYKDTEILQIEDQSEVSEDQVST